MNQLTTELESLYRSWLTEIPSACRPHFYNLSHQHQIVFLMKTPLERLGQPLLARSPVLPYIQACRSHLLEWLKKTGDVWTQIACALPPSLAEARLTSVDDLIGNVYFTDCVKCETKDEKEFKYHRKHAARCICDEFALLKRAVLFITLGGPAWDTIRGLLGPLSPVAWDYQHLRSKEPKAESNLMDVHGVLFESRAHAATGRGRFVIPLTFPGGRTNALRNSYLEYLKEGLAALNYPDKEGAGDSPRRK